MPALLFEFGEFDLELALEEFARGLDAALENFADAEKLRFVVVGFLVAHDDAGGGGELDLAAGENEKLLRDLLGVGALRQVDENLDLVGGVVVDDSA